MSPLMFEPLLFTELVTITVIRDASDCGGDPLFPGLAVHVPPQKSSALVANPLKDEAPLLMMPLTELFADHCEPQK